MLSWLGLDGELLALAAASHAAKASILPGCGRSWRARGWMRRRLPARRRCRWTRPPRPPCCAVGAPRRLCTTTAPASMRRWRPRVWRGLAGGRLSAIPIIRCRGRSARRWNASPVSPSRRREWTAAGRRCSRSRSRVIARALRAMVLADPGSPERMVADAMRAYPEWTSGTGRSRARAHGGDSRPAGEGGGRGGGGVRVRRRQGGRGEDRGWRAPRGDRR